MLQTKDAIANVAVKKIDVAKQFYENVLGLQVLDENQPGVISFKSGNSMIFVYESQFAGTNQATAVSWILGDELDETVRTLKSKGVAFEHYNMPQVTLDGDIHVGDGMRVAWFKDPDGNILSLISA